MTPDRRQVVWRPLGGPTVYKQWRFPSPVLQVGRFGLMILGGFLWIESIDSALVGVLVVACVLFDSSINQIGFYRRSGPTST